MEVRAGTDRSIAGGCQCGALRYALSAEPQAIYVCHCTECQRQSASAFGMSMPVSETGLTLTSGTPKEWRRTAASGHVVTAFFCPECGSRIFTRSTRLPGTVFLKCGTLDDTRRLRPVVHFWTSSAQPWVPIPPGDLSSLRDEADFAAIAERWQRLGCRLLGTESP
jgi:hypothetical protein